MNKTTNIVIGVVAAIALIFGVVAFNKIPATIVGSVGPKGESIVGPQGPAGRDGKDGVTKVITEVVNQPVPRVLGALTGPEIPSDYVTFGGLRHEYRVGTLRAATTTPCALMSPPATSTLLVGTLQVLVGTSTATTWSIAKATTAFATTTNFATVPVASGQVGTSTVPVLANGAGVFAPSTFLVFGLQGFNLNTTPGINFTGSCQAEFVVL